MKTKLLKKVRRRLTITKYPKGYYYFDELFKGVVFVLTDKNNECHLKVLTLGKTFDNEKDIVNDLKENIIHILKAEGHKGRKEKMAIKNFTKIY